MNTTQAALTRNRPKGQPVQWKKSLNEIEEMVCRQTEWHIRIIQTGRNAIRIEDKVSLDLVLEQVYDNGLLPHWFDLECLLPQWVRLAKSV